MSVRGAVRRFLLVEARFPDLFFSSKKSEKSVLFKSLARKSPTSPKVPICDPISQRYSTHPHAYTTAQPNPTQPRLPEHEHTLSYNHQPPRSLPYQKCAITLGYSLYQKNPKLKKNAAAAAGDRSDEKDYASRPHPVHGGTQSNGAPPMSSGRLLGGAYGSEQRR